MENTFENLKKEAADSAAKLRHKIPGYMDYMLGKARIGIGHCVHRCNSWVVVCLGPGEVLVDGPALVHECPGPPKSQAITPRA